MRQSTKWKYWERERERGGEKLRERQRPRQRERVRKGKRDNECVCDDGGRILKKKPGMIDVTNGKG